MSAKDTIAKTAGKTLFEELGAFFKRLGGLGHDLLSGEWVTRETWHARTGIVEKTFKNGIHVVEKPGAAPVASVPERWLAGKEGLLTELREGSWVRQETWHAKSGVTEKVFQNGVKVVETPGLKPVVTLPKRLLTKGVGKI